MALCIYRSSETLAGLTPGECGAHLAAAHRQGLALTVRGDGGMVALAADGTVAFSIEQTLFAPVAIPSWMRQVGRAAARAAALRDSSPIRGLDQLEGEADGSEEEADHDDDAEGR